MPTPRENEERSDFISRCVPIVIEDGTAEDQKQAVAVCNSMFEQEHEEKVMDGEQLVNFGGSVKALGYGHLTGELVKFTSPSEPDLEMDYFDASTDFDTEDGAKTAVYFNHRAPLETKDGKQIAVKEKIGEGVLKFTDAGILVDAIIYNRELYDDVIAPMAEAGKLGWSSGTAPHLVDREEQGKAYHIKRWPLGLDASVTPTPAEPRTKVLPVKALERVVTDWLGEQSEDLAKDEPERKGTEGKGDERAPSEGVAERERAEAHVRRIQTILDMEA